MLGGKYSRIEVETSFGIIVLGFSNMIPILGIIRSVGRLVATVPLNILCVV